jgi:hypothetical protein
MQDHPVQFICQACGLDASVFVDALVRRELGQAATPTGAPVPAILPGSEVSKTEMTPAAVPIPSVRLRKVLPSAASPAIALQEESALCLKHPGELAAEKCYVCGKPICPKCMELFGYACSALCKAKADSHGIQLPIYERQKSIVEARRWRKLVWAASSTGIAIVLLLALWFWYDWFGCKPKLIFSVRFPEPSYSGQSALAGKSHDELVFLHGTSLARYDLKSGRIIWSRQIVEQEEIDRAVDRQIQFNKALLDKANSEASEQTPRMRSSQDVAKEIQRRFAAALALHVRGETVWASSPGKLVRYDWETGKPLKEFPMTARSGNFFYRGNELLLVETGVGKPAITHIDLLTDATRREELTDLEPERLGNRTSKPVTQPGSLSRAQNLGGLPGAPGKDGFKPMDPSKVASQAQQLSLPEKIALPAVLAGNMNQQRALNEMNDTGRSSSAKRSDPEVSERVELIPAQDGFVEFSVKLLEARIVARSAMKGSSGKSALDGDVTAGKSMELSTELLNDMQRSNGGDVIEEDHSRYQITVRRPGTAAVWTGEVNGPPKLYPLDSVQVVAADKLIIVLDKSNRKLWQSPLNYNIAGGPSAPGEENIMYGQGPCVERKGFLYVYDEGVLSCFELATGNARWRLPSVGIAGLFFDEKDMLYVNTTTATHDIIKYSRQIDLSQKVRNAILKLDSRNGRILWSTESKGLVNYVSGKLILASQASIPDEEDGADTGFERLAWMRIRRINATNGREVWDQFQDRAPLDIAFNQNTIQLVFKKEVQVWRYPGLYFK